MATYKTLPRMSLMEALRNSYKEKFVHDMGRSRRSEFWWTTLVYWLLTAALSVGFFLLQGVPLVGYAFIAASIYITCVQIFAFVRRLHDSGHSGGALLNNRGEVVGITSGTYYEGSQANLNYAVSIEVVKRVLR